MRQISIAILGALSCALSACATPKDWSATGGSRADGVVRLSYEFGMFEVPQINEQQGVELAKSRCAAWGYSGAEPFGGQTKVCNNQTSSGCDNWLVTREYQCLGNLAK